MDPAQLSSISNTIQSNSDISSQNVWTTLCLRHSVPAGLWRGLAWHHFPIHIHMFFFSKQLLTAQLYTLILSEDAPIQVAVALWRGEKIIQLCWIRRKERVMLGDWLSRRELACTTQEGSRNDPSPYFRQHTGLGASLHLKQQPPSLSLLPRVCIEGTWQWGVNGETAIEGEATSLNNSYFTDRNLIFNGEKSKLTILSTFIFWQQSRFWNRQTEASFCWRKYPFLRRSRSFYRLIPPATQWCMPQNSMPGETGKGNDISSEPLKVDKEKRHSVLPPFSLSCHSDVLHP